MTTANRPISIAALSGIVFVVLVVVHAILLGSPPTLEDPSGEIVRYLADKDAEFKVGAYLQGLAVVAFLWFLGSVWQVVRVSEGGPGRLSVVAVAATAVLVALVGVHIAILTGLALRADEGLDAAVVSYLYVISFVALALSAFAAAALTGAIGVVILRHGALPRWLGVFSLVSAVLWLLAGVGATTESEAWGGIGFVAFLVWLVWTAVTSVIVARRPATVEVAAR
ncbi:MAG: hypothetical protein M3459_04800 [Actinomycetota bacterium]|nr:hypothetical protein [Actinomycetota bacterium]